MFLNSPERREGVSEHKNPYLPFFSFFLSFFLCCFLLQKVSEKVGGAEGTKLDDDFKEMEKVNIHEIF